MTYKPKDTTNKSEDFIRDIDKLLQFYRNGLPILPEQKQLLIESGYDLDGIKTPREMAKEYISRFKLVSTVWLEAVREGWDSGLENYILGVAWVQAQMICKERHIGFSSTDIFGPGIQLTKQEIYVFMKNQREQASTGHIDVSIPTNRLKDWQTDAEWRRKQLASTDNLSSKIAIKPNPSLESYINSQLSHKYTTATLPTSSPNSSTAV